MMELDLIPFLAQAAEWTVEPPAQIEGGGNWFTNTWRSFTGWLSDFFGNAGRFAIWACVVVLLIAGLAGTVVPFLPGTTLILCGSLLHFFALGMKESGLTILSLVIIGVLYIVSIIVDGFSGAIGAKWFGSSKWGVVGAILGGIIGTIFFNLPGMIIGPIVGVFVFEMVIGRRKIKEAGSSTVGTVIGSGAGMVMGLVIGLLMIGVYALDILVLK